MASIEAEIFDVGTTGVNHGRKQQREMVENGSSSVV